jgi:hypothetical protein
MASPEPGTIVRLKGINNFNVEFNPPAWGVIVDDGDNSFGCRPCATILIFNGAENFLGSERNSLGWWFYDNEIDVIPVDEVPDEVWVALGTAGLLGELTKC